MEYEQHHNGTPNWSFPSPGATPTNGSFSQNIFETPKASAYPTHFQDAFTTPQMQAYATPQQHQYPSMTPDQQYAQQTGYLGTQYTQHGTAPPIHPNSAPLRQGQFASSPGMASSQSAMSTSFGSIQVQTPPPTRGTSARKAQDSQQIAFGTPSTIASRRFMAPQHIVPSNAPAPFAQQTPMQAPQLQFSPDINQFVNLGASSAPVMPQSRMLWEQYSPHQPLPQATLDDPFAPHLSQPNPWSPMPGQHSSHVQQVSFDTPAMDSFPVQAMHPRPASAAPAQPSPAGVNPSLLYSSPAKPVSRPASRQSKARAPTVPESANGASINVLGSNHMRTDTVSSGSTVASKISQPLQRSNTVGANRPKSAHFSSAANESFSRSNSVHQIPRTASPVKRQGRAPLGSISEGRPRQRTSVILTVDENGIARTETRKVEPSPTRSMRERYPALFDSDESDAESDMSEQTPSKVASFTFDQDGARRAKAARLDPPVENLEGLSIPRSGSSASMRKGVTPSRAAVAAAAQLRRQGSLRKSSSSSRQSQSRRASAAIDSAPMETFKPTSSAPDVTQSFVGSLQASSLNDEHSAPPSSIESMLAAHNRRWSMMSFDQHQQPGQSGPLIRCLCGVPHAGGQPLIQCRSCTQWVHAACVGLESQSPSAFTCFLCTPPARVGALSG